MASTYTANQGIEKMDTGDQSGTWGGTVNTNMDIIDRAISGVVSITLTGSTTTLTTTDGTLTDGMYRVLVLGDGGDLGSDNTITISPNDQDKAYLIYNNLSADRNAIFTQGTGANATVQNGETAWIYADGGGSGAIVRTAVSSVKITDQDGDTQIQVEEGGDDDDTIRFDLAGAEDFTMTANSLNVLTGSVVALPDAAVGTPSLTNTGDLNTGLYFPAADTVGVVTGGTEQFRFGSNPIPGGSKNLVQNGAMTVNQRGTVTGAGDGGRALDQWQMAFFSGGQEVRYTLSQDSSGPGGGGFSYSNKVDCTTAESAVAAGEALVLQQQIEAQNLQLLEYGNAAAKTLTLSFWVSSPKTGEHGVSIYVPDGSRGIHSTYTIASADTWEHFTWTFAGDTGGTINNDTGIGFYVRFCLFSGSTYDSDTLDTWSGSQFVAGTNQVNTMDNTANNFYLTGVQLEVGSVATSFAHEDIGTTLNKCYRYFERLSYDSSDSEMVTVSYIYDANTNQGIVYYTEKRATPTVTLTAGDTFKGRSGGSGFTTGSGNSAANIGHRSCLFQLTATSSPWTAGQGGDIRRDGTDTTYTDVSSEL